MHLSTHIVSLLSTPRADNMKLFILAVCLFANTLAVPVVEVTEDEWANFKNEHGKTYNSLDEELLRQKIYLENKRYIEAHNERYRNNQETYNLKMNHLGDLLSHEVKSTLLGLKSPSQNNRRAPVHVNSNLTAPLAMDWREKHVVTPVKNQGQCGSCWSFSATGALEGQLAIAKGELVSLSEQNLVDCSTSEGNQGCNGGEMDAAFTYIQRNGGVDTEQSYPYTGEQGTCKFNSGSVGGSDVGYVDIKSGSEDDLKDAIATVGPVAVGIDASLITFQFYFSGVYSPWFCSSTNLDHGVLAVGYGNQKTWFGKKDYWLVKNSWGSSWGEKGYIKIVRNGKNTCGIATSASYPKV